MIRYSDLLTCHSGEGQFGKVYIAINLDNDVLMAMKEVIIAN